MSSVSVKLPTQLRDTAAGEASVSVQGETVDDCLSAAFEIYPALKDRITDDTGLRRFVNVYVDGEDVRFLDGLATVVADGSEITILPAVAGG